VCGRDLAAQDLETLGNSWRFSIIANKTSQPPRPDSSYFVSEIPGAIQARNRLMSLNLLHLRPNIASEFGVDRSFLKTYDNYVSVRPRI
jgi:hypothetical protein